ncbi:MAG: bL21 family ribosomal protein [Patescibacteria group bacterium]
MSELATKTMMVIEVGGKQHLADHGSKLIISGLTAQEGETIKAKDLLTGHDVSLKVLKNFLGKKVHGLKFKNKIRYTRRYGHRQQMALVEVLTGAVKKAKEITPAKPIVKRPAKKAQVKAK